MTITEKRTPANVEMEQSVLASIMGRSDVLALAISTLLPAHMTDTRHRVIYGAMCDLYQQGCSTDVVSVLDRLEHAGRLREAGGAAYLYDLPAMFLALPGTWQDDAFESHVRAITDKWTHRALIEGSQYMAQLAYDEHPQALDLAEETLLKIRQGTDDKQVTPHTEAVTRYMDTLERQFSQTPGQLMGVPTGYGRLDKKLGGLRPSKLYVLAARPGCGKTALALNIADHAVRHEYNVLFFSLEMDEEELMQRWFGMEAGIDTTKIRDNELSSQEQRAVLDAGKRLRGLTGRLWIDDTCGLSHTAIRSKAIRTHGRHGLDLIIVDYLQLAKGDEEDRKKQERRLEVEMVSRKLKELARELKIPVLALAQQNREVERRSNKKPQMSDFRDGAIENDADVGMFLHKDDEVSDEDKEYPLSLYIVKNRSGSVGLIDLYYKAYLTKFFAGEAIYGTL